MRRSSVVVLVVLLFLAGGCYATVPKEGAAPFLSCAEWIDSNRDGKVNPGEFSTRPYYPVYRDICFVGEIDRPFGTQISWKLLAPDGTVIDQGGVTHFRDNRVPADIRVYRHTYAVRDLREQAGPGLWRMEWFAGEERLGESTATLIW